MSPACLRGVKENLRNAAIVFDQLGVVSQVVVIASQRTGYGK
jgi:hypothetical protein